MKPCEWTNCSSSATGNSKYCKEHKALAREAWKAMIGRQVEAKETLYAKFQKLFDRAREAGLKSLAEKTPTPVTFCEAGLDGRPLPGGQSYYEPEGMCGFAWVHVSPGNTKFTNWLKKVAETNPRSGISKDYYGGYSIWVHEGNQSVERKEAYANSFAEVLKEGLKTLDPKVKYVYAQSRLD